jgi:hypothetical protein
MDYRANHPSSRKSHYHPDILQLPPTAWTSLYIPYLDSSYDRDDIIDLFEHKYLVGIVSRVDLVKSRPKNTGVFNSKEWVSAFVHFECWYDNDFTDFLRAHLNRYEKYNLREYMDFVPPTRRKFQPDHFQVLINRSDGTSTSVPPSSTRSHYGPPSRYNDHASAYRPPFRSASPAPPVAAQPSSSPSHYADLMHKQQKRIELLEEEINILRDLVQAKTPDA